jgi:2-polyprenyl-6-methoxyphenol hydroxylase-like FAD-dependent oxidoreductase
VRITCVGGGPAGLCTAIGLRGAGIADEVVVVERNPAGVTHGWGVTFWDELLDALHRHDPPTERALRAAAVVWNGQVLRVDERPPVFLGGSGYAVGRHDLLELLSTRARELGADVRFGADSDEVDDAVAGADLVVAADGVASGLRRGHAERLGADVREGAHRYIWLGSSQPFTTFTFAFVGTPAGWVWCYAYLFRDDRSTVVVECAEATWQGLGLDTMPADACLRTLEKLFAHLLDGAPLWIAPTQRPPEGAPAPWVRFRRVDNRRWHDGRVVIAGDAAHTTHFSIGSGTTLALGDAMALTRHLAATDLADDASLERGLVAYEAERRAVLRPLQAEADSSTAWFTGLTDGADPADGLGDGRDDLALAWSLAQRCHDEPGWRWYLLRATQNPALRALRSSADSVRRELRAQRRELTGTGRRS